MEPTVETSGLPGSKELSESSNVAFCVDLDGTLVTTDLLWEGIFLLSKENPRALFYLPLWLWKGIAQLKYEVARRTLPDFDLLPYRSEVLTLIHEARAAGRHTVLVSAAHESLTVQVAQHLRCFDEVIATRDSLNLKGERKRIALEERFGRKQFDYVGDAQADLPIWASARRGLVVTNKPRLFRQAQAVASVSEIKIAPSGFGARARAMRLHQWSKNILVFVPIIMAHEIINLRALANGALAFLAFSLVSSSVYLVNDLLDLQADRAHKIKRARPLATGDVSGAEGFVLASLLLVLGLALTVVAGVPFLGALLAGYFAMSFAYSCFFKRIAIMDVLVLAGFYTLRVFAGSAATNIRISVWLLAFSMFFFFSLALVKRCSELIDDASGLPRSRGYLPADLPQVATFGVVSGFISVLVLVLYVMNPEVTVLYRHPSALLFICPLLLYWISRVWLLTTRGLMHDDPIIFALHDRLSYFVGLLAGLAMYFAI
jgi:4-hydroxybenzoate polyprenyltransferase/phosphoglycolate phosphatase-like HAD superfamily hydrolase